MSGGGQPCTIVSFDIVGHSQQRDLGVQLKRVAEVNNLVRPLVRRGDPPESRIYWASGGDGGHVLFTAPQRCARDAVDLIVSLHEWSLARGVPLRVSANTGEVAFLEGADGRIEPVGHGINLAGRLNAAGRGGIVLVTEGFRQTIAHVPGVRFHDEHEVTLRYFPPMTVYLMSVDGRVTSQGGPSSGARTTAGDERARLREALDRGEGARVLLHAKRLLQINPADDQGLEAIRTMVALPLRTGTPADEFLLDRGFGEELVRAAQLVVRREGDLICQYGDPGQTMFLVIEGRLEGFVPVGKGADGVLVGPSFQIRAGELVGEMAFVLKQRRSATLRCGEDASLLAFNYQAVIHEAGAPEAGDQIERLILGKAVPRVLQNFCQACPAFTGPQQTGPLRGNDWVRLAKYCSLQSHPWSRRRIDTAAHFKEPGVYVLVSGKVQEPGAPSDVPPIRQFIFVHLADDARSRPTKFELLDDAKVLFIEARGLTALGPQVYQRIRSGLTEVGYHMEQAPSSSSAAAEESDDRPVAVDGVHSFYVPPSTTRPRGNVVFVHGLGGDAQATWQAEKVTGCWPTWLGEDLRIAGVWSIGYNAAPSNWTGSSMPVFDRATNVLASLESAKLLRTPLIFVCHSLGGLLVKEMLRLAVDSGSASFEPLARQTRGIAFLSTPHAGSNIAGVVKSISLLLRPTASVDELQRNDARLRELSLWYRTHAPKLGIRTLAFCEKQKSRGVLVVDETSADPQIPGVVPIPMDDDHFSICKPPSRQHLVYAQVRDFVKSCLRDGASGQAAG